MDYNSNYAKERLTGRGYFLATGDTSMVDLGNVQMLDLDFGVKRKEHFAARHGIITMDRYDAYASMGRWQVTIDEFTTPLLPFVYSGSVNANFSQNSATAATFNFNSKKGKAFDIGKYGLNNASLTTPAAKTEGIGADYLIDRAGGKIYIPLSTSIADAASCVVTYDAPALVYDSIAALSLLNRSGTLELQAEDDSLQGLGAGAGAIAPVRYLFQFPCILSADKSGQLKPDDYRATVLIATLTGVMTVKRLQ